MFSGNDYENVAVRVAKAVREVLQSPAVTQTLVQAVVEAMSSHAPKVYNEPVVALWASEVGSYLGVDTWSSVNKTLATVWRRTNEAQFKAVRQAWKTGTVFSPKSSMDLVDPFPEVLTAQDVAAFQTTASAEDMLTLYKTKGQLAEEEVASLLAEHVSQPVTRRHAAVVWKSDTGSAVERETRGREPGPITDPGVFTIVGEVDGWLSTPPYQDTIVEIKVRMQRIPPVMPARDRMQIQTYMHINNVEDAMYVQSVLGTKVVSVTNLKRDRDLWANTISPGLDAFVCNVRRLLRGLPEDAAFRITVLEAHETDHVTLPALAPLTLPPAPPAAKARKKTEERMKPISVSWQAVLPPRPAGKIEKRKRAPATVPPVTAAYNTRSRRNMKSRVLAE